MKAKNLILGGLAVGAATYGIFWVMRQQAFLKDSCYTIAGASNIDLTETGGIDLKLKIKNKSDINLAIRSIVLDIYIKGKKTTRIFNTTKVKVLKHSTEYTTIRAEFNARELFGSAVGGILFSGRSLPIAIKGNLFAGSGIFFFNIPINVNTTLGEIMQPGDKC